MSKYYDEYFQQKLRDKSAISFSLRALETEITQVQAICKFLISELELKEDTALNIADGMPLKIRNEFYDKIKNKIQNED